MPRVVTIDGPAGAGKSTVARRVAERLGWRFLDTGAMYRAVTFAALRGEVDLTCDAALARLGQGGLDGRIHHIRDGLVVGGSTQAQRLVHFWLEVDGGALWSTHRRSMTL